MIIYIILSENERLLALGKLQVLLRSDKNSPTRALCLLHKVSQTDQHIVSLIQLFQQNFELLCRKVITVVDHHPVLRRIVDVKSPAVVDQRVYIEMWDFSDINSAVLSNEPVSVILLIGFILNL